MMLKAQTETNPTANQKSELASHATPPKKRSYYRLIGIYSGHVFFISTIAAASLAVSIKLHRSFIRNHIVA